MPNPRPRARDLDIVIGALPTGSHNAITDVAGVRVGHVSLVEADDVRTGVTAVLPHTRNTFVEKVVAAVHVINGYGKTVGLTQIVETGSIETPVLLTSTLNVWRVADALVTWMAERNDGLISVNPVVGECNDGSLNANLRRLVGEPEVRQALESASEGPVEEGSVGAGVGMTGFGWKGGIGTSSRVVGDYTVGVLVLTNTGDARELRIDGFPFGRHVVPSDLSEGDKGSIIILLATDAPLTSRQLGRVVSRCALGLGRIGGTAGHGSGDLVIGFTTACKVSADWNLYVPEGGYVPESRLSAFFPAAVDATEEAILNSVLKADTMVGRDDTTRLGIPVDRVRELVARN